MRRGIDANILLRALLNDDPIQSTQSRSVLEKLDDENEGYVGVTALLEVFWVLKSRYRIPKPELYDTLKAVLKVKGLEVESFDAVIQALNLYAEGAVDFPDALLSARNLEAACEDTLTLDQKAAARVPGMTLLT
ncbi:MAG: type II toxin-antitoxin system VapC family toxin [Pseudomonadota bacterium]